MLRSLLLALAFVAISFAQPDSAWLFRYPGTGHRYHEPLTALVDDTGNVYVVGWSREGESRLDALLLEVDSLGHPVWAATYDYLTATGATRDGSGNIYIAGVTNGARAVGKICMLKYRPNGGMGWVKTYGEPGKCFFTLGTIAIDDSQNVYACGAAESSSCYAVRIVKYRPTGELAGVMRYKLRGYDYLLDGMFHVLGNGQACIALSVENDAKFADWLIAKLSADSRVPWQRVYEDRGSTWERLVWSQVDEEANIYLTGEVASAKYGTTVFCTMKMDSLGNIRWTTEHNGPDSLRGEPYSLVVDRGSVYVVGWNMCNKNGQEQAIALVKYDSLGNELWARQYGGADTMSIPGYFGEEMDVRPSPRLCNMNVDDSGNVYITGTGSTSPYSPFAVLLKYDSQGGLVWARKRPGAAWNGAIVGLDNKGALYDIGFGGSAGVGGIYVLKYRTR